VRSATGATGLLIFRRVAPGTCCVRRLLQAQWVRIPNILLVRVVGAWRIECLAAPAEKEVK